jgi:hypothetical protein
MFSMSPSSDEYIDGDPHGGFNPNSNFAPPDLQRGGFNADPNIAFPSGDINLNGSSPAHRRVPVHYTGQGGVSPSSSSYFGVAGQDPAVCSAEWGQGFYAPPHQHRLNGRWRVHLGEDTPAMERLQSSIDKCIAGVAMNNAAREGKEVARKVKFDARWAMMFEKQEMKIGLLKTNVAAIKRKEDLALLTADTSSICAKVKACHKAQCDIILVEMKPPPASSTTTPSANPHEAPNGVAPTGRDDEEVGKVFHI